MPVVDEIDRLNPKSRVSDLTVEQFFELISFHERSAEIERLKGQYAKALEELRSVQDQSAAIFKNATDLTVTTPFELHSMEDTQKFLTTVGSAINEGNTVILAMALRKKGG
jgi:lipopolysaccharide biosynthesis regulator YciM